MKAITSEDIEKLRMQILQEHDKFLEVCNAARKLRNEDLGQMLQRLTQIEEAFRDLNDATEDRIRALYRELNELRVYFGAPTSRPLEDEGVDFIAPYIRSLRLLLHLSPNLNLYTELIRTELALLEYRLDRQQHIGQCLESLAQSLELFVLGDQFSDMGDMKQNQLKDYLLLIHQRLMPLVYDRSQGELRWPITQVYVRMGAAFENLDCFPEEPDQLLVNTLIVAMVIQLMPEEPDLYTALYCRSLALLLWQLPLSGEQKEDVAGCYQKAQEVLTDA